MDWRHFVFYASLLFLMGLALAIKTKTEEIKEGA